MYYYVNNNKLYCSKFPVSHEDFAEITQQEYYIRLSKAVSSREEGTPVNESAINED